MEQSADLRFEWFCGLISSIDKEITRIRAAECAAYGLRGSELMCLRQLDTVDVGLTSSDLARRTGVTRAAMSRTVGSLEDRGLVRVGDSEAPESGRYRALVRLTSHGKRQMKKLTNKIESVMDEVTPLLSSDERDVLYTSLEAVLECLKSYKR